MYETEERLIEQAERLAAEPPPISLIRHGEIANDVATITAIERAMDTRKSVVRTLLPVYEDLRRRAVVDPSCEQLMRRAFTALLSVESAKDCLLYGLHQVQVEADKPEKK